MTIEFEFDGDRFPSPREIDVSDRRGCDAAPLDPSSAEDRLTLLAYIWPDQPERIERMRAALEVAAELPISVEREKAAPWVERQLAETSPDRATVLYHSIFSQYLSEEERSTFHSHIQAASRRADSEAPLAWLRMEHAGERADLQLTIWPGDEHRHLARVGYHGTPIEVLQPE